MEVVAIMNTIDRFGLTKATFELNKARAGLDFDLFINDNGSSDKRVVDWGKRVATHHSAQPINIGNPQGLNLMVDRAMYKGYNYICVLDNDIELPNNWLKHAITASDTIGESCGNIGFSWRGLPGEWYNPEIGYFTPPRIFGSRVIPRRVFELCGYFIELSKYGMWDSEWCERTKRAGFVNVYCKQASQHKGTGAHDGGEYREEKNRQLKIATAKFDQFNNLGKTYVGWEERNY